MKFSPNASSFVFFFSQKPQMLSFSLFLGQKVPFCSCLLLLILVAVDPLKRVKSQSSSRKNLDQIGKKNYVISMPKPSWFSFPFVSTCHFLLIPHLTWLVFSLFGFMLLWLLFHSSMLCCCQFLPFLIIFFFSIFIVHAIYSCPNLLLFPKFIIYLSILLFVHFQFPSFDDYHFLSLFLIYLLFPFLLWFEVDLLTFRFNSLIFSWIWFKFFIFYLISSISLIFLDFIFFNFMGPRPFSFC